MADVKLTDIIQSQGRRVSALEDEQSNPDGLTRIAKAYGNVRITTRLIVDKYTFRVCSDGYWLSPWQYVPGLVCDEEMTL